MNTDVKKKFSISIALTGSGRKTNTIVTKKMFKLNLISFVIKTKIFFKGVFFTVNFFIAVLLLNARANYQIRTWKSNLFNFSFLFHSYAIKTRTNSFIGLRQAGQTGEQI